MTAPIAPGDVPSLRDSADLPDPAVEVSSGSGFPKDLRSGVEDADPDALVDPVGEVGGE